MWVSTSGPTPGEFTYLVAAFGVAGATYRQAVLSLSAYDSAPVYVAFRCLSLGKRTLYLDDVSGPRYIPADVGATAILAPRAYEPPDTAIFPRVRVRNFGAESQTGFPVRLVVIDTTTGDTVYHGSVIAGTVGPQDSADVDFGTAWLTANGHYRATARTELAGDQEPRNDSRGLDVTVTPGVVHDVALNAILQPVGIIAPGPVVPRVEVENVGNVAEQFPTWFRVYRDANLVYSDSVTTPVPARSRSAIDFRVWSAEPGSYSLLAFTGLPGDVNPANDTQTGTVEVVAPVHDVGVMELLAPPDTVSENDTLIPAAVVENFGDYSETFTTSFVIGAGYRDTVRTSLAAGATDTLYFADWLAGPAGLLPVSCYTMLAGDADPTNDTITTSVWVNPRQGEAEAGGSAQPRLTVRTLAGRGLAIEFQARAGADATARIYDAHGSFVAELRARAGSGLNRLVWNRQDRRGLSAAAGVYVVRLSSNGNRLAAKAVLF